MSSSAVARDRIVAGVVHEHVHVARARARPDQHRRALGLIERVEIGVRAAVEPASRIDEPPIAVVREHHEERLVLALDEARPPHLAATAVGRGELDVDGRGRRARGMCDDGEWSL